MAAAESTNLKSGYPTPGPQAPDGQKVMDHVFFLSKDGWKHAREEESYDLVVIGSGFCGFAVVHQALKKNPEAKILMIERGPFFLPEHFQNLPVPYQRTLSGKSETFPWTVAHSTATGRNGTVTWAHGMVPFFGGRSTAWSAWCPVPTDDEMAGWPEETIASARLYMNESLDLLNVQAADMVDSTRDESHKACVQDLRPVYDQLQKKVQDLLLQATEAEEGALRDKGVNRTEPAPLASSGGNSGVDFKKFSVPGPLLELATRYPDSLHIACNCVVTSIVQQVYEGAAYEATAYEATALETSRGVVALKDAQLVLAMGVFPATTLVTNSFPELSVRFGKRYSAHFITSIVARVPRADYDDADGKLGPLEIGACYVAGVAETKNEQFHIQLSVIADTNPAKNEAKALRYMPDVVATASKEQLAKSENYVIFVCACLGEMKVMGNTFLRNEHDKDVTTNSMLRCSSNSVEDERTWDSMDEATFTMLEEVLSPGGKNNLEYWHGKPEDGSWNGIRPPQEQIRVPATVHESSTLHIGKQDDAPTDTDYRLKGTTNVFVTGAGLWPRGGSWNPTLTMVDRPPLLCLSMTRLHISSESQPRRYLYTPSLSASRRLLASAHGNSTMPLPAGCPGPGPWRALGREDFDGKCH
ncbi:unnamed protein product [Chrysoparadoxa australica]